MIIVILIYFIQEHIKRDLLWKNSVQPLDQFLAVQFSFFIDNNKLRTRAEIRAYLELSYHFFYHLSLIYFCFSRNTLNEIYFGKTRDIVNGLRSVQPLDQSKQQDDLRKDLVIALASKNVTKAE